MFYNEIKMFGMKTQHFEIKMFGKLKLSKSAENVI